MVSDDVWIDEARRREVDGEQLVSQIGIDDSEIEWRKAFTGFDEADERRLEAMADTIEAIEKDLVDEFYDHLEGFDETVEIFGRSSKSVDQLKQSQRQYLVDLGQGAYDRAYFERRARIGKIHDMLSLGPKVYLGAYSIYYEGLMEAIAADVKAALATTNGGGSTVEDGGTAATENGRLSTPEDGGTATTEGGGPSPADGRPGDGDRAPELSPREAIDELVARSLSVLKLLNLDQQVAMDTYIHSSNRRLERELSRQRQVVAEVDETVEWIDGTCADVTGATQEIREMTASQSTSMEQVAGEVSNMSATIEEIASTADEVDATSDRAAARAAEGTESAETARASMDDVSASVDAVVDDMEALRDQLDDINEIVALIDDLAERTNVLALNASIESARVGSAGEGFAVVANEVKQLAEATKTRAADVEATVDEVESDAAETVESLDRTVEQVAAATDAVETALDNLDDVAEAVRETASGISEVADATDDQAASAEEVASQVDQAVEDAERIAERISEVADANENVATEVSTLRSSVSRLTDGDDRHS